LTQGARKAWTDESQALATVGKKLQDFISGVSGFQVSTFDVSGYFVNEFDEDVGGAYHRNAVSATDNDFAQGRIEGLVAAINSSRLLYEALPAKIASALTIISTGVSGYSTALANGLSTLLDRVKSIGTIVSAGRIALGDAGDPEGHLPLRCPPWGLVSFLWPSHRGSDRPSKRSQAYAISSGRAPSS
jgi:hypothetical protein